MRVEKALFKSRGRICNLETRTEVRVYESQSWEKHALSDKTTLRIQTQVEHILPGHGTNTLTTVSPSEGMVHNQGVVQSQVRIYSCSMCFTRRMC
jgi:hypothetical protein